MKWLWLILLILVILWVIYRIKPRQHETDLNRIQPLKGQKPIIWLMTDSIMTHSINKGIDSKTLPALSFLIQHGQFHRELVSSYPTMSVTIDSTLITGTYPDQHHVPGLIWYDSREKRIVNYGTAFEEAVRNGPNQALEDAVIHLNKDHLNPHLETLFDTIHQRGFEAGAVNAMIYRGPFSHTLTFPPLLSGPTSLPERLNVKGPDFFTFGTFSNPLQDKVELPEGITDDFGFSDAYPVAVIRWLIQNNRLPHLTLAYLSDIDSSLHKKGPSDMKGLEQFDKELGEMMDAFGSWKNAITNAVWVICGDSGHTGIHPAENNPIIPLDQLLVNYQMLSPGSTATPDTEIVLCVNERSAFVYVLQEDIHMEEIANLLRQDTRIDLITWLQEDDWIHVLHTGRKTECWFRPAKEWTDSYDQKWEFKGDFAALDITADTEAKTLQFGAYPDALARLQASLHSHPARFMIVEAKTGYELSGEHSPHHKGGGAHGSLHHIDSHFPLIVTGTEISPKRLRMVDLKEFIIDMMEHERSQKAHPHH
ncbi:Predicted pyrophosphatase or phosphodiesterase, AlkP superfamily [Marininema mesophilum]|uniref:Predicted pyrophosphatase or phosphodiesterase, AlkP superfamily n=1 Tax=Marininema mesophilum TaxID=1048340 RepID=A0A1H2PYP9_9BACL|nr:alkaline phosphatase family protein [Marininema mesophilum]SDV99698.1 Predicted pyrophosphatase or phosphodiesterase, AlkP superfamily [Marininema mesophilum]